METRIVQSGGDGQKWHFVFPSGASSPDFGDAGQAIDILKIAVAENKLPLSQYRDAYNRVLGIVPSPQRLTV